MTPAEQAHVLRFVRGEPDSEQIVAATLALLAVLRARGEYGGPPVPVRVAPRAKPRATSRAPAWDLDRSYRPPASWAAAGSL